MLVPPFQSVWWWSGPLTAVMSLLHRSHSSFVVVPERSDGSEAFKQYMLDAQLKQRYALASHMVPMRLALEHMASAG